MFQQMLRLAVRSCLLAASEGSTHILEKYIHINHHQFVSAADFADAQFSTLGLPGDLLQNSVL
jgi:hypothetical protein